MFCQWLYASVLGSFASAGCDTVRGEDQLQKIVFDSNQLPGNDRQRMEAWVDTLASPIARLHIEPVPGVPFEGALDIVPLHGGAVCTVAATISDIVHATADVAIDGLDTVVLMISTSSAPLRLSQVGRDIDLMDGEAVLFDQTKATTLSAMTPDLSKVIGIRVPRELVRQQLTHLEDRFFVRVPGRATSLALIRAYVEALLSQPGFDKPQLAKTAASHLADLIGVAVGPLEPVEAAQSSGQSAARFIMIGNEIDRSFGNPGFSLTTLARRLGVTPRHIQRLLAKNETSFVDEVIERRLRRARGMLTAPEHAQTSIIAIAHECGFSTISHFHRTFRRKYAMTPGDMREHSS